MLLIVPMSLLGAIEVDTLKRGLSGALDWFGILTFGLVGALVWGIWWESYFSGMPPGVALALRDTSAGYRPGLHGAAMALCVLLTGGWLLLVRPARRSNRRAILNWTAGTMLVWALFSTIWLPYVDSRRSYRSLAEAAAPYLRGAGCIATRNVGDPQRALLYYFTGTETRARRERRRALQHAAGAVSGRRARRGVAGMEHRVGGHAARRQYRALRPLSARPRMTRSYRRP